MSKAIPHPLRWYDRPADVFGLWVVLIVVNCIAAANSKSDLPGLGIQSGLWSLPILLFGTAASIVCAASRRRSRKGATTLALLIAPVVAFLVTSLAWTYLPEIR